MWKELTVQSRAGRPCPVVAGARVFPGRGMAREDLSLAVVARPSPSTGGSPSITRII